jgi:hypothetical protein
MEKKIVVPEGMIAAANGSLNEAPKEIENLLWGDWERSNGIPDHCELWLPIESHNNQVIEAFRRGQRSVDPVSRADSSQSSQHQSQKVER